MITSFVYVQQLVEKVLDQKLYSYLLLITKMIKADVDDNYDGTLRFGKQSKYLLTNMVIVLTRIRDVMAQLRNFTR